MQDLSSPFQAARYHSLVIEKDSCPDCLEITAETEDGTIMAVQHRDLPHIQVQSFAKDEEATAYCMHMFDVVRENQSNLWISKDTSNSGLEIT